MDVLSWMRCSSALRNRSFPQLWKDSCVPFLGPVWFTLRPLRGDKRKNVTTAFSGCSVLLPGTRYSADLPLLRQAAAGVIASIEPYLSWVLTDPWGLDLQ